MFWKDHNDIYPISLKQWEVFFTSLKNFVGDQIFVSIAGGEPLIYKNIFDLFSLLSKFNFDGCFITNGYLINEEIAKKIVDTNFKNIALSLDSFNSDTHDYLRGMTGSYKKIIDGIKYLRNFSKEIKIAIMTIIMEKNIDDIVPLAYWVEENVDINSINFQAVTQVFGEQSDKQWYTKPAYRELWPQDINKVCNILDLLIELKRKGFGKIVNSATKLEHFKIYFKDPNSFLEKKRKCNALDFGLFIDLHGQIHLCPYIEPFGDIFHDIKEEYYSKKAENIRDRISSCNNHCHFLVNCNFEG